MWAKFKCNGFKSTEITIITIIFFFCILGGCKHSVAFLAWLHRRSHDRATTSIKCYWKKSTLSKVGTSLKFIKLKDLCKARKQNVVAPLSNENFLTDLMEHSKMVGDAHNQLTKYFVEPSNLEKLSIHYLTTTIKPKSATEFMEHCKSVMTTIDCDEAAVATSSQNESPLWHELRYARITASKAYEAAHSKTFSGALTESIMGATKLKDTEAMKRGRLLEGEVIKEVAKLRNIKIKRCGLLLNPNYPIMGASPDGETPEYSIEIKCPFSEAAFKRYITGNTVASKYMAQVQLQMHFSNKLKALFCVAQSDFESSKKITIIEVDYNKQYCDDLLKKCIVFWTNAIFPKLRFL